MKLLLMADQKVGAEIANWLFDTYPQDIGLVVTPEENRIADAARSHDLPVVTSSQPELILKALEKVDIDLGLLAWWPAIIKDPLLSLPRHGFVNTHPSLLPHGRGKHYNFWTLVEQAPFGVSLHFIDEGVDTGDLIAQRSIPYSWEDNGESLHRRAQAEMVELIRHAYPNIRKLAFVRTPQNPSEGTFHRASELENASLIDLDKRYSGRELLNLLRARTYSGHPACRFVDDGETYEVRVQINRKPR
jgi:methionyl-tRNA formyltransferase